MAVYTIDAKAFQKMFLAGAKNLEVKKEWINDLNVFPVPDGDTGTNMTLTIMSAAKEVVAITNPTLESLAKAISSGSLRGARGNSGVILSQLFRGFTKEIREVEQIDATIFANALERGVETAYKAVMKPKEGTILTVAKGAAEKATEMAKKETDMEIVLAAVIEHADYVLSKTPDMLPVLKQAGVVDSGGQGFLEVLRGFYDSLMGKEIDFDFEVPATNKANVSNGASNLEDVDIKFGYCTEFIIMLEKAFTQKDELAFKAYLESIGDSIVCVADDDIVKIHVHTNDPGLAIQKALTYGQLTRMKIDNMREEHQERLVKESEVKQAQEAAKVEVPRKPVGFIGVCAGEGLAEIFKGLGADYVIEGGQTMNPSTEDVLNAADNVNADVIYILPNNSNIILAAEQASKICKEKQLVVVPSKTVPQGIAALIRYQEGSSIEENLENMSDAMKAVKTGSVTYAVRDTVIDDKEIKEGDIMGIGDKTIMSVFRDVEETTIDLISQLADEDSELISIYYGTEIDEASAEALADKVSQLYPDAEVEMYNGGQPVYYYLLSVE